MSDRTASEVLADLRRQRREHGRRKLLRIVLTVILAPILFDAWFGAIVGSLTAARFFHPLLGIAVAATFASIAWTVTGYLLPARPEP